MLAVKGVWDRLEALTVESKTLHQDALAGSKAGREDTALLDVCIKARDPLHTLEQDIKSQHHCSGVYILFAHSDSHHCSGVHILFTQPEWHHCSGSSIFVAVEIEPV